MSIPDPDVTTHLQFRRFAGCPICNLHLRSVARRVDEITAAGVREVAVFHAPDEDLLPHIDQLPFAVIGDPDKRLYREFGVEARAAALLNPRAWPGILKSVIIAAGLFLVGRAAPPKATPHGGRLGLPADFLVGTDGRVLAAKYGEHADDQWSVDELLAAARGQADDLDQTALGSSGE